MTGKVERDGEPIFFIENNRVFIGALGGVAVALCDAFFERGEGLYFFQRGVSYRGRILPQTSLVLDGGYLVTPLNRRDTEKLMGRVSIESLNKDFESVLGQLRNVGLLYETD
jgi:hypothetical protein